jgi:hypothetical protein
MINPYGTKKLILNKDYSKQIIQNEYFDDRKEME